MILSQSKKRHIYTKKMREKSIKNKIISVEKVFAIYIFVAGLFFSVLIPAWQVPDEYSHLSMMMENTGNSGFEDTFFHNFGMNADRVRHNEEERLYFYELKDAITVKPAYEPIYPKALNLDIIDRLPATIGFYIGMLFRVSPIINMELADLFALMFYTVSCYYAIKIMPIKKEVLGIFMAMPMAIQQAASISYDAVLLPVIYIFISYIFYIKYESKTVRLKDITVLFVCLLIIANIKIPYVLLVGLIFIIPLDMFYIQIGKKLINKKILIKCRIPVIIIGIIASVFVLYLKQDSIYIRIILGTTCELKRTIELIFDTIIDKYEFLLTTSVGGFGWLDASVSVAFVVFFYLFILLLSLTKNGIDKNEIRIMESFILMVLFCVMTHFTFISMFNHTVTITRDGYEHSLGNYNVIEMLYSIPYIGGLQGRYFIPFIPLIYYAMPGKIKIHKYVKNISIMLFELITFGYSILVLLNRYWVI